MDSIQMTISSKKAPIFIRIFLILILSILILIPLVATFFTLAIGEGNHLNILASFILCWGVGFYLLKIVLWNTVGQEILILNQEKISYTADYRLFKNNQKEIEKENLETEIIYSDHNKSLGRLLLKNKKTSIETVLQTRVPELEKIRDKIVSS